MKFYLSRYAPQTGQFVGNPLTLCDKSRTIQRFPIVAPTLEGAQRMITLPGSPALSEFRLTKLLSRLQQVDAGISRLSCRYMHFVDYDGDADGAALAVLQRLVQYGPALDSGEEFGRLYLVVPRPGTISPWSSKATDIAHSCGLDRVRRIERGIAYHVEVPENGVSQFSDAIAAVLHDRMVETVLGDLAAAAGLRCRYLRDASQG